MMPGLALLRVSVAPAAWPPEQACASFRPSPPRPSPPPCWASTTTPTTGSARRRCTRPGAHRPQLPPSGNYFLLTLTLCCVPQRQRQQDRVLWLHQAARRRPRPRHHRQLHRGRGAGVLQRSLPRGEVQAAESGGCPPGGPAAGHPHPSAQRQLHGLEDVRERTARHSPSLPSIR